MSPDSAISNRNQDVRRRTRLEPLEDEPALPTLDPNKRTLGLYHVARPKRAPSSRPDVDEKGVAHDHKVTY